MADKVEIRVLWEGGPETLVQELVNSLGPEFRRILTGSARKEITFEAKSVREAFNTLQDYSRRLRREGLKPPEIFIDGSSLLSHITRLEDAIAHRDRLIDGIHAANSSSG